MITILIDYFSPSVGGERNIVRVFQKSLPIDIPFPTLERYAPMLLDFDSFFRIDDSFVFSFKDSMFTSLTHISLHGW